MGQLAAFLPYIATAVTAYSAVRQGEAANAAAKGDAAQMRAQANTENASAQRAFLEDRRQANYVGSRARAVAAASGAGVTNPTVSNILSGISAEGEYRALTDLYQGQVTAQGLQYGADARIKEGKAARNAGYLKAAATVLSGAGGEGGALSMFDKYGNGGPESKRLKSLRSPGRAVSADPNRGGGGYISSPTLPDFTLDPSLVGAG